MKRAPTVVPLRSTLHCVVDSFDDGQLLGWAHDPQFASEPAQFFVLVDGEQTNEVVCGGIRPDVARAGLAPESVGFRVLLPRRLLDGQEHHVELRDRRRLPVLMRVNDQEAGSFNFSCAWRPVVRSYVDGLRGGGLEGWVLQTSYETGRLEGNCVVRITCDGMTIGHTRANQVRSDVGRSMGASAHCGFRFVPPPSAQKGRKQTFRFYLMPGDHELEQSPITASLISDESHARLQEVAETVDRLHAELTRLRRQIREVLPQPVYSIESYDRWYPDYARALTRRVIQSRVAGNAAPLVSVICPVYRPVLEEFSAAVQSVIAQTYQNWELILVDDASGDGPLSACIAAFAKSDRRIKPLTMRKNGGISRSTNVALDAARGDWVAFFDHDDLLADVALEVMVRAAQATGAKVLYSDEDKVDAYGNFMAPAFKPDWNHRLILGVNYVCHLLFAARAALATAGPLDPTFDGAQDHDLILRLSEHVPAHHIRHVPEILYHWRITANSTASGLEAKPYAAAAGVACVEAHLRRLGRPAVVTTMEGRTLYRQRWKYNHEPSVEIIIPFKDQIATTRQCLEALLTKTRYRNYSVTLVDNWSTSAEAVTFCEGAAKIRNVRILRLEEPFNFSRLNNVAAERSTAEFLVLMNNDLFVGDGSWLRICVDEALADPAVAVVGGKFVYPSRNVQHAGVVTGIGGIAGHVGIGLPEDDHGYGGRLLFAQEYSAVTAAAMLVRRSVFEALGAFDEKQLTVAFNDVDLCLKARAAGYKVIYTPDFLAEHHESLSRGDDERPAQEARFFHENEVMKERWRERLNTDPFYNKNFSLERGPFTELRPPEIAAGMDWFAIAPEPPVTVEFPRPPALPDEAAPAPSELARQRRPKQRAKHAEHQPAQ